MHNRTPEVSVFLAGETGFVFRNLQWQLGESEDIDLLTPEPKLLEGNNSKPDYIIYIYNDDDALGSHDSCKKSVQAKLEDIGILAKQGNKLLVLGAREDQLDIQGSGNIFPVPLPIVFGKWAKPHSDSPIAMACDYVLRNKENELDQPESFELLYVDDLAHSLLNYFCGESSGNFQPAPVDHITLSELKSLLVSFRASRKNLLIPEVGKGLVHALYATYISYLDKNDFSYPLENHADHRGSFIEILKTETSGQISCLTAGPGVTRGQHYHHSKSEKFLVVKGEARFCFRNLLTEETCEIIVSGKTPRIVETIPGWVHNITNISDEEMIVILWANELFNPEFPDTIPGEI